MARGNRDLKFLSGLQDDLKRSVLGQLRDLWTHHSTAIEGNTLSLADTHFVLSEGLTVKGKAVKDHNEVIGHAKAIDLLYGLSGRDILIEDIFNLHSAVQTEVVSDIFRPNGAWKREPNGTYGFRPNDQRVFIEFAALHDVATLMDEWVVALNSVDVSQSLNALIASYARLHIGLATIHPFWDGNGRLARLLCNIPLIRAGLPPLVIANENRQDYIASLNEYSLSIPIPTAQTGVWTQGESNYQKFTDFCYGEYQQTKRILEEAWAVQKQREAALPSKM